MIYDMAFGLQWSSDGQRLAACSTERRSPVGTQKLASINSRMRPPAKPCWAMSPGRLVAISWWFRAIQRSTSLTPKPRNWSEH